MAPNRTMRKAATRAARHPRPGRCRRPPGSARATTAMSSGGHQVGPEGHLAPLAVEGDAHGQAGHAGEHRRAGVEEGVAPLRATGPGRPRGPAGPAAEDAPTCVPPVDGSPGASAGGRSARSRVPPGSPADATPGCARPSPAAAVTGRCRRVAPGPFTEQGPVEVELGARGWPRWCRPGGSRGTHRRRRSGVQGTPCSREPVGEPADWSAGTTGSSSPWSRSTWPDTRSGWWMGDRSR